MAAPPPPAHQPQYPPNQPTSASPPHLQGCARKFHPYSFPQPPAQPFRMPIPSGRRVDIRIGALGMCTITGFKVPFLMLIYMAMIKFPHPRP
ncbi:hypothetical protein EJ06DRAFT_531930 [Trichodelitschia bisporula]|uniref:Transmembrane protein n=1 Tax=Trichodelitschia bisporula TaxID=703511 RepID=A0A6G1HS85_9PEZI|nr:hypothetical protein EJ06DRAFT_531930 [Trichodelitschia bisporula]